MPPVSDPNRVIIFDTTLRDGEQSPGCSMNLGEKLEMARALRDLGVDVIEAGFPIASPGDFESVQAIARTIQGPIICGLARCNAADIDRAADAVKDAAKPRIHVFLATSAIHREFKLRMTARRDRQAGRRRSAACARGYVEDVEFSPEDAARTELDFLAEVVEKAVEAGATTLNIPDTVGYAVPVALRGNHPLSEEERARHRTRSSSASIATTISAWRCQQPRRPQGRGPAGRMHHQRHRRTCGQLRPRRNRHGHAARVPTTTSCRRGINTRLLYPHQPKADSP